MLNYLIINSCFTVFRQESGRRCVYVFVSIFDSCQKRRYIYHHVLTLYFIMKIMITNTISGAQLTSVDGETTSHLMGIFYRTIRFIENGIKPVYVFDGKPPELKSKELVKRSERREDAQKELDKATEAGDAAMMEKFNRRLVKVTSQHVEEAKQLLKLMGVPYVEAPCEAEAQCATMVCIISVP